MSSKISYVLILTVFIASLLTLIVNGSPDPQDTPSVSLTTPSTPTLPGTTPSINPTETTPPTIPTIPGTSPLSSIPGSTNSSTTETEPTTDPSSTSAPPTADKSTSPTNSSASSPQFMPRTLYVIGLLTFIFELFLIIA
ncbi:7933_t:CDS:2 [Diversispora eburnea]|uniref:7933_t:CDS:1 n=1 Tax=Diversispora eburnea TaxID=1213867 RepID=A0A9N8WQP6_9GLOM|nr:7933_t:CDS:2 [Diversispora eburnea]